MTGTANESFVTKLTSQFNMLWFIMPLGFGGTAVGGFAFLNNTLPRNPPMKGMLYLDKINEYAGKMGGIYATLASDMKVHMLYRQFLKVDGTCCTDK